MNEHGMLDNFQIFFKYVTSTIKSEFSKEFSTASNKTYCCLIENKNRVLLPQVEEGELLSLELQQKKRVINKNKRQQYFLGGKPTN